MRAFAPILLAGCASPVVVTGTVGAHLGGDEGAEGLRVALHDADFRVHDETTTGPGGAFELTAPRGEEVHVVVEGDGLVPIAFRGESGLEPTLEVPSGTFWAFRPEDEARWREDFAGCPGAADAPGLIVGTLWFALDVDDVTKALPVPTGLAFVEALDPDTGAVVEDSRIDACYLADAKPEELPAHDPAAVQTGRTGRFAIFGVEGGPWGLTIGRYVPGGGIMVGRSTAYVPEGGAIHRHPALVPL